MCRIHKKYKAVRPPMNNCIECWEQWIHKNQNERNFDKKVSITTLYNLFETHCHEVDRIREDIRKKIDEVIYLEI